MTWTVKKVVSTLCRFGKELKVGEEGLTKDGAVDMLILLEKSLTQSC